jgi:O-antigen/teichoic acid export membrane protein
LTGIFALKDLHFTKIVYSKLKEIAFKSTPYALVIVFTTLLDRIDLFLVERWFGLEAAGVYAGPAKIIQSITLLVIGIAVPIYAELLKVDDKEDLSKHIGLSLWITTTIVSPIIFGIPFIEHDVLGIVFTDLPSSADGLLTIQSLGLIGSILIVVFGFQLLMSKSKPWAIISGALVALIFAPIFVFVTKDILYIQSAAYSYLQIDLWYCLFH